MKLDDRPEYKEGKVSIKNLLQETGLDELRAEIISGLTSKQKFISSKYFYNEKGSQLFKQITHLEEYYLTRTEKNILKRIATDLVQDIKNHDIIELGSGDCSKINILLETIPVNVLETINYIPVDVSRSAILKSISSLKKRHPVLTIDGYFADFTNQLDQIPRERPALICFLGSTIGNFDPENSLILIKRIIKNMLKGDIFLLGLDLIKQEQVLYDAYNDPHGVTADFNKNILNAVNDIIDSNFDTRDFNHKAFFNHKKSRIEMHLMANTHVSVNSPFIEDPLIVQNGETIHTENSYKYSMKNIHEIAQCTELKVNAIHSDTKNGFVLVEFRK